MKFSENIRIFKQQVKSHFVNDQVQMFVLFLDDFFPSEKIFNFFGYPYLNRLHNDEQQKLQIRKRNHFWLSIFVSLFLLLLITINFVISIMNPERFMEAIECFVLFGAYKFNLLRTFFLCYWKRATIKKIIDRLDQNFPHSSREQVQFGVHKHFKTLRKFYQICVTVYLFFWVKSFVAILFTICSEFLGFGSMEPKLLVPIYFPVDPYQPLLYPIFLILQLWTFLMVKFMLISTDMLFFGLTCVTSMEFDICARKIAQIDSENDENTEKKLGEIIDDYNELIEIANELEDIFSPIMLINVFTSIFSLCLCVFLSFTLLEIFLIINFIPGILLLFTQLFCTCYYGELLQTSSMRVANEAYNCNWYGQRLKFRKMILLTMLRTQEPQKLTGMKFMDIGFPVFYWALQTAHSYYSLLSGLYGD